MPIKRQEKLKHNLKVLFLYICSCTKTFVALNQEKKRIYKLEVSSYSQRSGQLGKHLSWNCCRKKMIYFSTKLQDVSHSSGKSWTWYCIKPYTYIIISLAIFTNAKFDYFCESIKNHSTWYYANILQGEAISVLLVFWYRRWWALLLHKKKHQVIHFISWVARLRSSTWIFHNAYEKVMFKPIFVVVFLLGINCRRGKWIDKGDSLISLDQDSWKYYILS